MSQPRKMLHLPKVRMLSRGGRPASGIRITNVKSIRPPNPEVMKKQENDKLRAEVQKEIANRSRSCAYPGYECLSSVVSGRRYCATHILQDPTAPYIQCTYSYGNGERCIAPAPESKEQRDEPLCFEHARAALLARQKAAAPPPPVTTTETLLNQLLHYVKPERPRTTSCASSVSVVSEPSEPEQVSPIAVDPFKQMDATCINASQSASILSYGSGSDSDGENVTLGAGGNARATRASPVEGPSIDPSCKWRAGVFTAEEAICETKTTLCALQSAYLKQMDHLKYMLQSARLQYCNSLKQEKEQYCSINTQARSGPQSVRERRQLRKLKAYAGYHRKHGIDAVLARKLYKKRTKVNDVSANRPIPSAARCTFIEETVRCTNQSIPASKHCSKHILHDRNQVLFGACSDIRGVDGCKEPVAKLPLPSDACRYHTDPPAYTVFTLKKDDTDSETDSQTSFTQLTDEGATPEPLDTREATEAIATDPLEVTDSMDVTDDMENLEGSEGP